MRENRLYGSEGGGTGGPVLPPTISPFAGFLDPRFRGSEYLEIFDEAHASDEDRFIAIGPISRGVVLVVYKEQEDDRIRIISARFATTREAAMYRAYMGGRLP